jgi:hypothetical protein
LDLGWVHQECLSIRPGYLRNVSRLEVSRVLLYSNWVSLQCLSIQIEYLPNASLNKLNTSRMLEYSNRVPPKCFRFEPATSGMLYMRTGYFRNALYSSRVPGMLYIQTGYLRKSLYSKRIPPECFIFKPSTSEML